MNKRELREEMRRLRREMTAEEAAAKSAEIRARLFALEEYQNAKAVMLYVSAFKEPSTEKIIRGALEDGKRVAVPVSDAGSETITPSYIEGSDDFIKGAYGIWEPKTVKKADASEFDFILVPGLAFDKSGNRMGFGKGYYDKLLKDCRAVKTALCYAFQLFDKIPADAHDIPMNIIITEEETYAL